MGALQQAIYERCDEPPDRLVHHSDRGAHYLSMRYPTVSPTPASRRRSAAHGIRIDNALAESVIGLFKTEVIRRQGTLAILEAVEFATLEWVDWFNTRRLLEPIGHVPAGEHDARY